MVINLNINFLGGRQVIDPTITIIKEYSTLERLILD